MLCLRDWSLEILLIFVLLVLFYLYKEFTEEQGSVTPVNGWKAYYAATKAIVNVNSEFFSIIIARSLHRMAQFWLNADYVKSFQQSGELFSGYLLLRNMPYYGYISFTL